MKQTVEEAAREYRIAEFPNGEYPIGIKDIEQQCEEDFIAGAEWQRNSVWRSVDTNAEDGSYLTVIQWNDKTIIEIAPWRDGKYQGEHHMHIYLGQATIVMYANINDIMPIIQFDEIIEDNKDVLQRLKDK